MLRQLTCGDGLTDTLHTHADTLHALCSTCQTRLSPLLGQLPCCNRTICGRQTDACTLHALRRTGKLLLQTLQTNTCTLHRGLCALDALSRTGKLLLETLQAHASALDTRAVKLVGSLQTSQTRLRALHTQAIHGARLTNTLHCRLLAGKSLTDT